MEKISRILPANARVTTVDMKNSGVARSGMPSFGRDVGVSSLSLRGAPKDVLSKATDEHSALMDLRLRDPKIDPHVEIVQKMSDNFFLKRKTEEPAEIQLQYAPDEDLVPDLNLISKDPTTQQSPEPSDEEPYLGQSLNVHV